jgi:uncharacterized membrane protein
MERNALQGRPARLHSIDLLRGVVIAIMALDHVRDYFGPAAFAPDDLAATTPGLFWTRWITHLCASVFVLLAGTSAGLRGNASGTPALARHLATRGAMLLVLEATWISFSWQFGYHVIILQVIWAIGAGMLLLSLLVWMPRWAIAMIAAGLILPHNLLDGWQPGGLLWIALHQGGFYGLGEQFGLVVMYPLIPWLGLMAAGYAMAPVFGWQPARRQHFLLMAGVVLLLVFVALRASNLYGDPDPWSAQGRGWLWDLMSFVRVHKYPPSLLYLCVTVGIGMLLLALFERAREVPVLSLFGRTPLFFYCVHIALIHFLGKLYMQLRFGSEPHWYNHQFLMPNGYTPSLAVVYTAWLAVLTLLYGLTRLWCRWRSQRLPASA